MKYFVVKPTITSINSYLFMSLILHLNITNKFYIYGFSFPYVPKLIIKTKSQEVPDNAELWGNSQEWHLTKILWPIRHHGWSLGFSVWWVTMFYPFDLQITLMKFFLTANSIYTKRSSPGFLWSVAFPDISMEKEYSLI